MTSTLFFSLEKKNWIAYWNRALVFGDAANLLI